MDKQICPSCHRKVYPLRMQKEDILTTPAFYKKHIIMPEGIKWREICYYCGYVFSEGKLHEKVE